MSDDGYKYSNADLNCSHEYLLPEVESILTDFQHPTGNRRIFELGCGNGSVANRLFSLGYDVTAIDPSNEGIAQAKAHYPNVRFHQGSAYDDLSAHFGTYPILLSLEVIEHVYYPRKFTKCAYSLLDKDGIAIISTPFHGYWKNLVLAVTGKLDNHFTALWDHGHIKFWSMRTLSTLLEEAGFRKIKYVLVGRRFSPLAKSMIAIAQK